MRADFGDGYQQRTRDGINHIRQSCELAWEFLTHEQADAIVAFFTDQGGDRPFLYKPVNLPAPIKWTCDDWTDTVRDDGFRRITATLEQSFTIEL